MALIYEIARHLFDVNPLLFLAVCALPGLIAGGLLGLRPMRQAEQNQTETLAVVLIILCFFLYAFAGFGLLVSLAFAQLGTMIAGLVLGIVLGVLLGKRMVKLSERTNARRMGRNEFVSDLIERIEKEHPAAFYVCDDGVVISATDVRDCPFFQPQILDDVPQVIVHRYTSDFAPYVSSGALSAVRFADSGYEDMSDINTKRGFADALRAALPSYKRWDGEISHDEFYESEDGQTLHNGRWGYWAKILDSMAYVFTRASLVPKRTEPKAERAPKPKLKSW